MTNAEKYKTAEARAKGFETFCSGHICEVCPLKAIKPDCGESRGQFAWLELETEWTEPLPCPYCGMKAVVKSYITVRHVENHVVECSNCQYRSGEKYQRDAVIADHNRVARAVMSDGKKEEKEWC